MSHKKDERLRFVLGDENMQYKLLPNYRVSI